MNNTFLLSEQDLKKNSIISNNASMDFIYPYVRFVDDSYAKPILGTALYNLLIAAIQGDNTLSNSGNARYKYLMDNYLTITLIWWVMYESVIPMAYKIQANGITQPTPDNQRPLTLSELETVKDSFRTKAQMYSKRAVDYLITNTAQALTPGNTYTWPEYTNPGSTLDTIVPKRKTFKTGIYLGIPAEGYFGVRPDFEAMYQGNFPWPFNNAGDI